MPGKFFGGVHPAQYKSDSSESEIRSPRSPELLVIPMSMHVGAQCRPLVKKGDSVELGQLIGDSDAAVSAPIHSSVSGTVIAVENRPHPGGSGVLSVVIANDFKDTPWRVTEPRADISDLSPEDIADIIRSAGIVGLGGAAFPTHIKVRSGLGKVDTVIINGAECEPYITSGYRGMVENADDILGGARILKKVYGVESVAIAIEDNKADAIRRLRLLLPSSESHIRIISLKTRYPQGAEKQLIQAITRRQVPAGRLPADVGCAVFNTDTAAAVYRAVYYGEPLTQKVVTVAGSSVAMAGNLRVRIGTPISELFSACGIKAQKDFVFTNF